MNFGSCYHLLVRISTIAYFKIHMHSIQSRTTYIWNQKTVWPLLKHFLLQEIKILLLRCFILNGLQPLVQMLTLTLEPTTYTSYTMSPDMTQTHLYTVCTMHCRLKCQETLQERPQKTSPTCFAVFFFLSYSLDCINLSHCFYSNFSLLHSEFQGYILWYSILSWLFTNPMKTVTPTISSCD